jgi:hypothetical protein
MFKEYLIVGTEVNGSISFNLGFWLGSIIACFNKTFGSFKGLSSSPQELQAVGFYLNTLRVVTSRR